MISPDEVKARIEAGIDGAEVEVDGDGRHFRAVVVAAAFEGLSMVQQHQRVYAALGDALRDDAVHALSIQSYTPEAWARARKLRTL